MKDNGAHASAINLGTPNKKEFMIKKWTMMKDHNDRVYKIDMEEVCIIQIVNDTDHLYIFKNGKQINFKIDKEEPFKYIA